MAAEFDALRLLVPEPYHVCLDAFSKRKGSTLPPRRPYDHRFDLEDGTSSPFGPIYSIRSKVIIVNTGTLLVPTHGEAGLVFLKAAALEFSIKDHSRQSVHTRRGRD